MNRERSEADLRVDSLHTAVILDRKIFFACMENYGRKHARSAATASEIADAAAADCHGDFASIATTLHEMPTAAAYPYRYDPDIARQVREKWEASNETVLAGLADQGRQRAVRAVVEARG